MSEQTNLSLVQGTYAAFGQGDMETFFNNLADTIIWESRYPSNVPFSGTYQGKAALAVFFSALESTLEINEFVPQKFIPSDDLVVVLGYEQVKAKPTGVAYRNEWVHIFTIQDEKVVKVQASNDAAAAEAAFQIT